MGTVRQKQSAHSAWVVTASHLFVKSPVAEHLRNLCKHLQMVTARYRAAFCANLEALRRQKQGRHHEHDERPQEQSRLQGIHDFFSSRRNDENTLRHVKTVPIS
jgi:hypothetical protein